MKFDTDRARQYVDESAQKLFDAASEAGELAREYERQQAELDRLSQSFDAAWKRALAAGWSEADLKKIGLEKPRARRRPSSGKARHARTQTKPTSNTVNTDAESTPEDSSATSPE